MEYNHRLKVWRKKIPQQNFSIIDNYSNKRLDGSKYTAGI